MRHMPSHRRRRTALALLIGSAAAAGLAACGGGFYVGIGGGDGGDASPSVSITTAAGSAPAGGSVRVVAAAADDYRIDSVAFFRVDNGAAVLLGQVPRTADDRYEWLVAVPDDGRSTLVVFARAIDDAGQRSDSAALSLPVTRL